MNITKNLLKPDLELLIDSQERMLKYINFIDKKEQEIEILEGRSGNVFIQRATILDRGAQYLQTKGTVILKDNVETINPFYENPNPVYNDDLENIIVNHLSADMSEKHARLTSTLNRIDDQIIDKKQELDTYVLKILVPKHSGKPAKGTKIYPDTMRIMRRPADIISLCKKRYNVTHVTLEDAKIALGNDIYMSSDEAQGQVTSMKTPVDVNRHNFLIRYDEIVAEIAKHEDRITSIKGEERYVYPQGKVRYDAPIIVESPIVEEVIEEKAVITTKKSAWGTREMLDCITLKEHTTKITHMLPVDFTWDTTHNRLLQEAVAMPKAFIPKEEMYKWQHKSIDCPCYDFTEYDKRFQEREAEMTRIDPKYYKPGDMYLEWTDTSNGRRYSNLVAQDEKIIDRDDYKPTEYVTVIISQGCSNTNV